MGKRQQGFTLIEILVAMAIFSMIGLASTGILTSVIDSDEISQERFEKLQTLQRAMLIIERDVLQAIPRPVRLEGERTDIVMKGGVTEDSDADGIGFVRGGWQNPQLMLPRSTQQFVAYRLRDNKLERVYSNYVDNVIGFEPQVRVLLDNVADLNIEFYVQGDDDTGFGDNTLNWSESYVGAKLPRAVAFEIDSDDFGLLRREFALTGNGS
ncbi:type II secretion system minor pseudopilin GspJ [Salinimonas chungwhensis]|uniref:type II secretion system minor pseudopilin GspJ n=1 Tax=Salinimonas chungwhensis TaxID=265425 RepID=UPI00037D9F1C|nr:type II secretion system minor pseudopilin GspJ [Salinimonas chungwhensis]